jgi:hypothetical protein
MRREGRSLDRHSREGRLIAKFFSKIPSSTRNTELN